MDSPIRPVAALVRGRLGRLAGHALSHRQLDDHRGRRRVLDHHRRFGPGIESEAVNLLTSVHYNASKIGRNSRIYVEFTCTDVEKFTASQYTSFILRNFMRDRANQTVLGIFLGIFVYCVVVLRTIRGGDEGEFAPSLAVLFGVVLSLVGIGCLIFFIHHIASSIQAESIIKSAADETIDAIDRLFPDEMGGGRVGRVGRRPRARPGLHGLAADPGAGDRLHPGGRRGRPASLRASGRLSSAWNAGSGSSSWRGTLVAVAGGRSAGRWPRRLVHRRPPAHDGPGRGLRRLADCGHRP